MNNAIALGRYLTIFMVAAFSVSSAQTQHLVLNMEHVQDELLGFYLPKIAVAADGSYGIAAEALFRTSTGREVLRVAAQRYSAAGVAVGPTHVFEGESCSGLDIWLTDFMERPEIAFHPGGLMLVLMQHTGEFQLGGDGVRSAELTIGGIGTDGQLVDLNPQTTACVQSKLIFVGGDRQDRPRFDLTPSGEIFITADGFFDGASLRAVAIRVLDADGNEVIEEAIPHVDTGSEESFHMYPDIATNGNIMLSAWHRCPIIDNQGNAEECDVEVQFATISEQGLQAEGGNERVNAGDPTGTMNAYPSVAMNAAGESVVAWVDTRDDSMGDIYAQRFSTSGRPVGGNFRVSVREGAIDARPELAILQNGRFMIAWTDSSAAGFRARARRYDAAGNPEGAPFELAPANVSGEPSVAADGENFAHIYVALEGESTVLGSNKMTALTSVEDTQQPNRAFSIAALYPNPFTDEAHVTYELGTSEHVMIRVYDVLGREVDRLVEATHGPGHYTARLDGTALASGLYVMEMRVGSARQTISLIRRP